jgi:hypothetical protein
MRYFLLFLMCCPFLATAQFAAGFAPLGAVWQDSWWQQWDNGDIMTTVTNSQTMGNTTRKTLRETTQNFYNHTTATKWYYLTIRHDSVWITTDSVGQIGRLLFDFGANVGDSLDLRYPGYDTYAQVDSVRTINFLGQPKRAIYYNLHCYQQPAISNWIDPFVVVQDYGLLNERWNWETVAYSTPCVIACGGINYSTRCYADSNRAYPQNCLLATDKKDRLSPAIQVYPNPARDILTIKSTEMLHKIVITDILGTIMVASNENSTDADIFVENLPQGAYFLRINDVFVQKIMILK